MEFQALLPANEIEKALSFASRMDFSFSLFLDFCSLYVEVRESNRHKEKESGKSSFKRKLASIFFGPCT